MQSAPRFGKITEPIMTPTPGTRVGPYATLATSGVGVMGDVYRACKTTVTSDVARKALKGRFTADRARLARFPRQAEVLVLLDHSNLGCIYGFVESAGTEVPELTLLDGPTLDGRTAAALCQWHKLATPRSRSSLGCLYRPGIVTSAKEEVIT
jgi:serine/threonine protein kinase